MQRKEEAKHLLARVEDDLQARAATREYVLTLDVRFELAKLDCRCGDYSESEKLFARILPKFQENYGNSRETTIATVLSLVNVYPEQEKFEAAKEIITRAILATEDVYGRQSFRFVNVNMTLANICYESGNLDEAQEVYHRCLEMALEPDESSQHTQAIEIQYRIAAINYKKGNFDIATMTFERLVEHASQVWGAHDPETLRIRFDLTVSYFEKGEMDRGTQLMVDLLKEQKQHLPLDHSDITQSEEYLKRWSHRASKRQQEQPQA